MKLWILTPTKHGWKLISRFYEEATVIVRAASEPDARSLAANAVKEHRFIPELNMWRDPVLVTCKELVTDGNPEVLVEVFSPTE